MHGVWPNRSESPPANRGATAPALNAGCVR
jgi:hypothetical protein